MFVVDRNVEIGAPAEVVWEVITDVARYPEWNSFVIECQSTFKPGEAINMKVMLGGKLQKANEVMLENVPGRRLSYRMKPFPAGALSSMRSHELESPAAARSRYLSHFELKGWMMPLVRGLMGRHLENAFTDMTNGIKQRAEQLWAQRQGGRG